MEDELTKEVEETQQIYVAQLNSRAIQVISHQPSGADPSHNHVPFLTLRVDLSKSKTQIRGEFLKLLDKYWQGRFA